MTVSDLLLTAQAGLAVHLFTVAGTRITLGTVVAVAVIMAGGAWASRLVKAAIGRAFALRGVEDVRTMQMVQRIAQNTVLALAVISAFQTIGIDLDALLAAGAVFAVGFGLAMQSVAKNLVSGVILLMERSIRPGDVLEVDGQMVHVEELTIRTTVVRTLDGDQLIVPNATLAQGTVRNFTKQDRTYRLRVPVGVSYASDVATVSAVLEQAGRRMPWRTAEPEPEVLFLDYGKSALIFELSVWTEQPDQALRHRSAMRLAIWNGLKEAGIRIALPQLDVHLDMGDADPAIRLPLS
ncbi:MAG: mechanosensitive ion channel domain-containing protein [Myxococcota bacterium]|nr:mechanosensitive ion channel domain-containing protein [Myxococcota bacterium]